MRTARSRTSGENLFDFVMAPSSQTLEPPQFPGRFKVQVALEMGSRESVREAVAEGLGLGVVAETAYRPDPRLVKLTISDTSMATQVHFICRKERHQAPLISTFLGLAHSVSQKIA